MATARLEDLHGRIVHFGEKHLGSTFQEAMLDSAYVTQLLQCTVPIKKFEEVLFAKYVAMALAPFRPGLLELEAGPLKNKSWFLRTDLYKRT